jgi:protein-disulfide isomerase
MPAGLAGRFDTTRTALIRLVDMSEDQNNSSGGSSNDRFLPVSIIVAAVMISGAVIYSSMRGTVAPAAPAGGGDSAAPTAQQQQQPDVSALTKLGDRDVILGDPNAPVTIIEYSDFQCPFCGRFFNDTEPQLRTDYIQTGKARMVYRELAFLGPESVESAKAAECAKDQNKFWTYHDELFKAETAEGVENSGNLKRDLFVKLANDAGLDAAAFADCYDSGKYSDVVQSETSAAQAAGINATPTFVVNGQMLQGAQPYASFKSIIDGILTKNQ